MKRLLPILLLMASIDGFAQSESFNPVTYDTLISCIDGKTGQVLSIKWPVRITRDLTYFQDIARDSNLRRPVIVTFGGKGEVSSGNFAADTPLLSRYGPEYAAQHGWDYGIKLGNGVHKPIYVTVLQAALNIHPQYAYPLFKTLKTVLQPRGGSFLCAGLSEGSWIIGDQLCYSNGVSGNTDPMSLIKCWVNLTGVGPETFDATDPTVAAGLATWATRYGGKFFGLEGTTDGRNIYNEIAHPMNVAVPGSAFFSYETYFGGGHGGWNNMYDPTVTNWRCIAPIVNANISANAQNSMGTYFVDGANGSNIFQWMLRQGDTTLVGGCGPTVYAGPVQSFYFPKNSTTLTGTATYNCSHTSNSSSWTLVSGPNTPTISTSGSLSTAITGLVPGTYIFQLAVMDNTTAVGSSIVSVTVLPEVPPTASAGGPYSTSGTSITLTGTASANGGAHIFSTTWSKVSGSGITTIANNSTLTPTMSGLQAGRYTFQMIVIDDNGNSTTVTATVTVSAGTGLQQAPGHRLEIPGEYLHLHIPPDGRNPSVTSSNKLLMGTSGLGTGGVPRRLDVPVGVYVNGSAGLHTGHVINDSGRVYTWGDNDLGQAGIGIRSDTPYTKPRRIAVDALGNQFSGVIGLADYFTANVAQGVVAWKANNDTIWVWGDTRFGMKGNGTAGDTTLAPFPIVTPGKETVKDIISGTIIIVLCTNGKIYTYGGGNLTGPLTSTYTNLGYTPTTSATDFRSLHAVVPSAGFDATVTAIAGGSAFNYALTANHTLYNWGAFGGYMGDHDNSTTHPLPVKDTAITNHLPTYPVSLATIYTCTHAILADGTLWGWGNNPSGEIGYGVEPNQATRPFPWNWDPGNIGDYLVQYPQKVTDKNDWAWIFRGMPFVCHFHAEDLSMRTYTCGRGKGVAQDGTVPAGTGVIAANYANSWDHADIYPDSADALTTVRKSPCEGCGLGLVTAGCNDYTLPDVNTNLNAIAGNGTLNTTDLSMILFSASTSDDLHGIVYYKWTCLSGAAKIEVPGAALTKATFPGPGTYVFQLKVTDNQWSSSTTTVTVVVSNAPSPSTQRNYIIQYRYRKKVNL